MIHENQNNGKCNAHVLDGSDLVHMLMPHKCNTFDDYAEKTILSSHAGVIGNL